MRPLGCPRIGARAQRQGRRSCRCGQRAAACPSRGTFEAASLDVGQDGGVLEAWVETLMQKGHTVAAAIYVLAVPGHHVRPAPQH